MSDLIIRRGMAKMAAAEDGPSFEQQFGILANADVVNKYPKLDNMKLAFQLIDQKNDQAAMGAVVYMVGTTVIFVPAFYKNGKLETGDMMFLPQTQQFLPLSDPWLAWVEQKNLQQPGEVVEEPDAELINSQRATTIKDYTDPIIKTACVYLRGLLRTDPDLTKTASAFGLTDMALAMGKTASERLIDELADNKTFLNATLRFYDGDAIAEFAKTAALVYDKPDTVKVILPFTKEARLLNKAERTRLDEDGFLIKRAAETPSPTVIRKRQAKHMFIGVNHAGKYKMPLANSDLIDVIALPVCDISDTRDLPSLDNDKTYGDPGRATAAAGMLADWLYLAGDSGQRLTGTRIALSDSYEPFNFDMVSGKGAKLDNTTPVGGSEYYFVCPDGVAYKINNYGIRLTNDGVWAYEYGPEGKCILVKGSNDDQLTPIHDGNVVLIPSKTRVITVPYSDELTGSAKKLAGLVAFNALDVFYNNFISQVYDKVKITSNGDGVVINDGAADGDVMVSIKEASLKLVRDHGIDPDTARDMIKDASAGAGSGNIRTETYLITKTAEDINQGWQDSSVPMHETRNIGPQHTFEAMPMEPFDPAKMTEAVTKAAETGIKEVFDVTAFKLLVRQNDFMEEVQEDIPRFMNVLDALCRKLFLLYWHTEDFEDKYGAIKLKLLEQSLKNALDSLSEITIFFKMRNTDGMGDDGGDLMRGHSL